MNKNGRDDHFMPVPLLGARVTKVKIPASVAGLVRRLELDGTLEADGVMGPNGQPLAVVKRSDYYDGEQLLAMIRQVVREEILAAKEPH